MIFYLLPIALEPIDPLELPSDQDSQEEDRSKETPQDIGEENDDEENDVVSFFLFFYYCC